VIRDQLQPDIHPKLENGNSKGCFEGGLYLDATRTYVKSAGEIALRKLHWNLARNLILTIWSIGIEFHFPKCQSKVFLEFDS